MSEPQYRVIHWGTGVVGMHALRHILHRPDLELVGLYAHSAHKVGRDAGEIAGDATAGVFATDEIERLLMLDAECVTHIGHNPDILNAELAGSNSAVALEQICQFLAAGKDVISTTLAPLAWPLAWGAAPAAALEEACRVGRSTYVNVGIHPGFMCDRLALTLSGASQHVDGVHCQQLLNYGNFAHPERLQLLGFGLKTDEAQHRLAGGSFGGVYGQGLYGCTVQAIADGLGFSLESIIDSVEFWPAAQPLEIPDCPIARGAVVAVRTEITGVCSDAKQIRLEHVSRIDPSVAEHWPNLGDSSGFRVHLLGRPALSMTMEIATEGADPIEEACLATAALAVNAIPMVRAAEPGVLSGPEAAAYSYRRTF